MAGNATIRIDVLQEDITDCREARQGDPRRCMLSNAVQRSIPDALFPDCDMRWIRFSKTSTQRRYFYQTPRKAMQALLDFDAGKPVKPFSFTTTRGFSEVRRSKAAGYVPSPKRYRPTGSGGSRHASESLACTRSVRCKGPMATPVTLNGALR
jgi:hypothetical protein